MDGEENKLFCSQCGKELPYNAQFCQYCGGVVAGTAADEKRKDDFKKMEDAANEGRISLITFLILIYGIPALIMGIYALCSVGSLAHDIWTDTNIHQYLLNLGFNSETMVRDTLQWMAVVLTVSGACACASAILCFLRRYWLVAVILCFAAAILCVWSIFGAIIGIFVGWMLITAKISFDEPREFGKG